MSVIAIALAAAQSTAGLPAASVADVLGATRTCVAASDAPVVDRTRLTQAGWRQGSAGSDPSVDPALAFWSHGDNDALILTMANQPLCTVLARVDRTERHAEVRAALGREIGGSVVESSAAQQMWIAGERIVQFAATGNRQAPSVRVTVMQMKGSE